MTTSIFTSDGSCCGLIHWHMFTYKKNEITRLGMASGAADVRATRACMLENLAKLREQFKTSKGVASCTLNDTEKDNYKMEDVLLEFGFKKVWGDIPNPNTSSNLHCYIYNLSEYRTLEAKKISESALKKRA